MHIAAIVHVATRDDYIAAGDVEVNGEVVTQMGVKVLRTDEVKVEDQTLSLEKFEYIFAQQA